MTDTFVVRKAPNLDLLFFGFFIVAAILSIATLILGAINVIYAALGAVGLPVGDWVGAMGVLQLITAVTLLGAVGITFVSPIGMWPKVLVAVSFILAAAHGLSAVLGWAIPSFGPFWTPVLHLVFVIIYWRKLE